MEELLKLRDLRHRRYGRMTLTRWGALALGGLRIYIMLLVFVIAVGFVRSL